MALRASLAVIALAAGLVPAASARAQQAPAATGPADGDERGLWMQVEEAERRLKGSNFLIRDPGLNAYVRDVFCRTVGRAECAGVRIYITRTPFFNASMAPNGMMQVWSGLFLRMRDEAQLAAVLGHEYTHYKNRHSLQLFRQVKDKTNAMAWMSFIPYGVGAIGQLALASSVFDFSRDMEREADTGSLAMLVQARYDPLAASRIWEQVDAEMTETAKARGRKKRGNGGMFATHPRPLDRMADLKRRGEALRSPDAQALKVTQYRAALAPYWADLIDDQIKLNDFGGTELLLGQLASEGGWTGDLLFARGELYRARGADGDFAKATQFYEQAVAAGAAPIEVQRGLGLALLRAGRQAEGQAAIRAYLLARPDAKDRAIMKMLTGDS